MFGNQWLVVTQAEGTPSPRFFLLGVKPESSDPEPLNEDSCDLCKVIFSQTGHQSLL